MVLYFQWSNLVINLTLYSVITCNNNNQPSAFEFAKLVRATVSTHLLNNPRVLFPDMALAVAMEMEEKRKREAAERGEDSDEGEGGAEGDDEGVVYSLDEITASMQKGAHPSSVKWT